MHTTRTDFDQHDMQTQDQTMEKGKTGNALAALDHLGTGIEPLLKLTKPQYTTVTAKPAAEIVAHESTSV